MHIGQKIPQEVARMAFQWIQLPLFHSCSWKQSKSPTCMKLVITGWNPSVTFLDCTAHCFLHLLWQFTEHDIVFMKKVLKCKDEHKKPKKYYKYLQLRWQKNYITNNNKILTICKIYTIFEQKQSITKLETSTYKIWKFMKVEFQYM